MQRPCQPAQLASCWIY